MLPQFLLPLGNIILILTLINLLRQGVTFEDLKSKVDWLREEITCRGGTIAYEGTTSSLVESGLTLLGEYVAMERKLYVPALSPESEKRNKSILVMDFYRNQILPLFNLQVTK